MCVWGGGGGGGELSVNDCVYKLFSPNVCVWRGRGEGGRGVRAWWKILIFRFITINVFPIMFTCKSTSVKTLNSEADVW